MSVAIQASTVALLRDVDGGVEVCMLRRPGRSSFAAGAFVFPGGALDAADGSGEAAHAVAGVREVHDHLVWVEPVSGMSFPSPEDEAKLRSVASQSAVH